VRPDAPYLETLSLEGATEAEPVTVRVEDAQGRVVMVHES